MEGHCHPTEHHPLPLRSSRSLSSVYFLNKKKAPCEAEDKHRLLKSQDFYLHLEATYLAPPTSSKIMPRKASTSKRVPVLLDSEEERESRPRNPDILYDGIPFRMKKPRLRGGQGFWNFIKFFGVVLSFLVGGVVVLLGAVAVTAFVLIPRMFIQALFCLRFHSQGLHLLPISASLKAAGYEFYTVVFVLRGECRMEKIMQKFQGLIGSPNNNSPAKARKEKYPELRRKLGKRLGFYCYEERKELDLKNHVTALEEDPAGVTQSKLFQLLQSDFKMGAFKVLRTDAPEWEALVIPKFKYDPDPIDEEDGLLISYEGDRGDGPVTNLPLYAVVFRAHSAILDKQTALRMFKEDIMDAKDSQVESPEKTGKLGKLDKLVVAIYSLLMAPWLLICKLVQGSPSTLGIYKSEVKSSENTFREEAYVLTYTRTMSLAAYQKVKDVTNTTITSVISSCIGGSARNMVLSQDKPTPKEYRLSIKQFFNQHLLVYNCVLPSETHSYPLERLWDTFFTLSGGKHDLIVVQASKAVFSLLLWVAGAFPAASSRFLYKWLYNVHIVVEIWELDGPFQAFGGDLVADVFAWNAIAGTWADFGVTATTYSGRVKLNFIGDNEVLGLGSKVRKNILPEEYIEEYIDLAQPCNIKHKHLFRSTVVGLEEL